TTSFSNRTTAKTMKTEIFRPTSKRRSQAGERARPKFLGAAWQRPQLNIFERGLLIEVYGDRGVGEFEVMVCSSLPVGKEKRKIKSLAGAIYHMFSGVTCSSRMIMSIPWSSPPFVTLGASQNLSSNTSTALVERRTFKSKNNRRTPPLLRGVRGLLNVREWRKWGDDVNAIIIGRLNDSLRPSVLYKPTVAAAPFRYPLIITGRARKKDGSRRFVLNEQSKYPESRGDFTILLSNIVLGCKFVCSAVNKAGLAKLIGLAGDTNIQACFYGEEQKKLNVLSNDVFVKALVSSGRTSVLVPEEDEEATFVESSKRGKYCVVFDPLDGSSNIDCGVSIGTIFGIYTMEHSDEPTTEDVLKPGNEMVAAGYCMYGSSCMLVLSTGTGVNGFTLDPSLGEFILTHPDIKIPKKGNIYSVNEGNAQNWDGPTTKYVERCKYPKDGSPAKSLRYVGSMVADVHPTLLYGGIFLVQLYKTTPNHGRLKPPYRRLTPEEYAQRKKDDLCFRCDEKYVYPHVCSRKELMVLVVHENGTEIEISEEQMEHREDEEEEITEVAELSVNSVVGLSAPHTIKLRGTINGEEVVVLIDSGATHNFISESLVRRLGLTRGTSRGYGVMVGGGMIVQGKGICEEVQLKCSSLKFLSVDNNNIKDTFPFWLKGLPNLQAFTLRSNRFYGPISPPGQGPLAFPELRILEIADNKFTGSLPQDYFVNWKVMTEDGSLLKTLIALNLSNNAFTGHIPRSLENVTELESLDLSRNKLSGEIPRELKSLSFLAYISVAHNQLKGEIPQGPQFSGQAESSFEGNPGLCGLPLQGSCFAPPPTQQF
ncbi:unnamed protein product, partial [Brassica oleracea]